MAAIVHLTGHPLRYGARRAHVGAAGKSPVWGVTDFPLFQLHEGPRKGSGSFDGELQALSAGMAEFDCKLVRMILSVARNRGTWSGCKTGNRPGRWICYSAKHKLRLAHERGGYWAGRRGGVLKTGGYPDIQRIALILNRI